MHDCEVLVANHARTLYMQLDERAVQWIETGFSRVIKNYMGRTEPKDGGEQRPQVSCTRIGVRDIKYRIGSLGLKSKGPEKADIRYATEHGLKLGIGFQYLGDKDLEAARKKAFRDAIKPHILIQNSPVPGSTAMSHTDGENDGSKPHECEENICKGLHAQCMN